MARSFVHFRAGQGTPLLQARKGEVSSTRSHWLRLLPRLTVIVAIFSLAVFDARTYSQNMNSAPVLARRHVDRFDPHDRPETSRGAAAGASAIAATRAHSHYACAH